MINRKFLKALSLGPTLGILLTLQMGVFAIPSYANSSAIEDQAQSQFRSRNFSEVIKTLQRPLNELSTNSLKILSRSYQELDKMDQAVLVLEYLKAQNPKDHLVSLNLARVYLALGRAEEGLLEYRRTSELQPQYLPAYTERLKYFEERKEFSNMRILLTDMLEQFGERDFIVHQLCRTHFEEGFVEQSKAFCSRGISLNEAHPSNHVYLGLTHKNVGEVEQARQIIRKAGERFPASELAQWAAGEIERDNNNLLGAESHLLRAKDVNPESIRVLKSLSLTQFELGKYEEALAHYSQWCKLERRVPDEFRRASGLLLTEDPKWHQKYTAQIANCNS